MDTYNHIYIYLFVYAIPEAELRKPQVKDPYHGELVIPPGELATKLAVLYVLSVLLVRLV